MKNDTLSTKRETADIVINAFKEKFHPSFEYTSKSGNVKILILDKYDFMSNMAATLLFDFEGNDLCTINIVVAGGKEGLLHMDFGAEDSLLNKIKRFLQECGYEKPWKEV
jgi:hypothetical protein